MKNLIFTLSLLACTVFANAQISKGRQMIGCNFNLSNSKNQYFDSSGTRPIFEEKLTGRGIGLKYGYFVSDKIMIGVSTSLNTNRSHSESIDYRDNIYSGSYYSNSINLGVFARYYKMLGKSKFAVFGQAALSYNKGGSKSESKSDYTYTIITSKTTYENSGISGFATGGFTYFLNKNIALETSLASVGFTNYKTIRFTNDIKNSEQTNFQFTTFNILSLSSLNLGLNFYFGGKKKENEPSATQP